jgi:purine nucleosidase
MKNVIFNHDAAVDEYMAGVLLSTMPDMNVLGIIVTNGDCVAGPAMDAAYKIQQYIGQPDLPLYLSPDCGWNSFPWAYRGDCVHQGEIDCLSNISSNPNWPWYPSSTDEIPEFNPENEVSINDVAPAYPDGNAFLAESLDKALISGEKITLLICCPMTILRGILSERPEREAAIEELIWMGGVIAPVKGNLESGTIPKVIANSLAEWNAFWDTFSVAWVFKNTKMPITVFPLNVTNQAKITDKFKAALKSQSSQYALSLLADQSYSLVDGQDFYEMWDVLTTSYLARPDLFSSPRVMNLNIVTGGYYEGTLFESSSSGRSVNVVLDLDNPDGFYDYVLESFRA